MEDVSHDQAGANAGKGTALDKAFFLEEGAEVEIRVSIPDGGGVRVAEIVEGEEIM